MANRRFEMHEYRHVLHRMRIGESDCVFRRKPATDSEAKRPPCNPDFTELNATLVNPSVCSSTSGACAIELDDASHNSKRRQERDEFLRELCEAAGIRLIQIPAKSGYFIEEVKRLLPRHLVASEPVDVDKTIAATIRKPGTNGKVCPNCSAPMVKKVAKNGSHAGKTFWACSAFPNCKTIEAIGA